MLSPQSTFVSGVTIAAAEVDNKRADVRLALIPVQPHVKVHKASNDVSNINIGLPVA